VGENKELWQEIEQTWGFVPDWFRSLPSETMAAEWRLLKNREVDDSPIPNKYRQLIGLAVSAQMQCPYSVAYHTEIARLCGATDDEIEDAVLMAKHAAGWGCYLQGMQTDLDTFKREVREVCDAIVAKSKAA
jgi:AhpD family alkylhydroperoxidase